MDRKEERIITLGDLWTVFCKHFVQIAAVALICVILLMLCSTQLVKPKYNSTSTLYILKQDSEDYSYTQSDFTLAMNIVNDCTYMLESHTVLDEVISKLDLEMNYDELCDCISTKNPDNTRVLEVSVKTDSAKLSKLIVDEVCRIASEKIGDAMGMKQINVYAFGTLENKPCNSIDAIIYVFAAIGAAFLTYCVYIVAFAMDDKIRTQEDVEKYLGLSVLGEIPDSSRTGRKNSTYGAYYAGTDKAGKSGKGRRKK